MSKAKATGRMSKKKQQGITGGGIPGKIIHISVSVYVFAMFLVFPLYYQDKYYNMGEAKYEFFRAVTWTLLPVALLAGAAALILYFRRNKGKLLSCKELWTSTSLTDRFVMVYAVAVWISFAFTPYKADAVFGYEGWYMGLVSQMAFVCIYFLVSRFFRWKTWFLNLICIVSAITFLLAVLNRFQIDPLNMYETLSMTNKILFLSTLGQATWYSSFLCTVFPVGLYLFWSSERGIPKLLYGIYVFLGFATMVTQNSDSAFAAFAVMLLILFCASFVSERRIKSFLEVLIIGMSAWKLMGLLQAFFPEKAVALEPLSIFASQSVMTSILLAVVIGFYIVVMVLDHKKLLFVQKLRALPKLVCVAAAAAVVLAILGIYLTTTDHLPGFMGFLKNVGYFNFDSNWGNGRGFTWMYAAEMFQEYPWQMKLFGCGPDCFASYSYANYSAVLSAKWGDNVLTNAHNEWFTSLLYFGVFGFISYTGIFLSQLKACIREAVKTPFLLVAAMAIGSYMGHNFFCYQQIICTPLIFILMGMAEKVIREGKRNAL